MTELPKAYEAKTVDPKWYQFWNELALFQADASSTKPGYCIVIPPPNVTGVLHMGHALVNTLQDVLIRWKRMSGFETLWVPGTDHAGIATQTVVERHLIKTQGKRRTEFSKEDFLKEVWKWKDENESRILDQIKRLGCSCDFSRLRFTMDKGNNRAVRTMFKKLYDQGLIYKGDYLVNWDPVSQTALADDEVEYEERQGFLWHFNFPLKDGSGHAEIATTRPETMLGDTAIAVSPRDERYRNWIGKEVIHPITNRSIPIIADHFVDPEFGTGMVKITPAHDPNDYQMGLKHNLPFINIMTPDGKINENGLSYEGMTMQEARDALVSFMKEKGLLVKISPHVNRVGISYRSKAAIEPYLSKQWFVKMSGFAERLKEMVDGKEVRFIPDSWVNTYNHWINNLRDWCISRQLWWGHQIPIWTNKKDPSKVLCYAEEGVPSEVAAHPDDWEQETDVLDTWFSSALWPFATLGWPEQTPDLKKFYPNSTLITGHDILFFWVARMLAFGDHAMGKPPFPETFLHGLIFAKSYWRKQHGGGVAYVSDEERKAYDLGKPVPKDVEFKWEKMSKSKGNVIDPLEIIDEYGTDAMRMALCASATQAREIDLDRRKFEEFRNFTNKVWNGARFVLMNLEGLTAEEISSGIDESTLQLEDRWILSKLSEVVSLVNQKLTNYEFDQAALAAYDFFWKEFCAYYVEFSKPVLFGKKGTAKDKAQKQKLLLIILLQSVRLLHPMAPFITEELFQLIKQMFPQLQTSSADAYTKEALQALQARACAEATYPRPLSTPHEETLQQFGLIEELVYALRNLRAEMKLPPQTATDLQIILNATHPLYETVKTNIQLLSALVKLNQINIVSEAQQNGHASLAQIRGITLLMPLPAELIQAEKTRLKKEEERLLLQIQKTEQQLSNNDFCSRAPAELISKLKATLEENLESLRLIRDKLD
ncbi:MAG: valine--tRNA ligase [Parachlamydiaceae bacterium]